MKQIALSLLLIKVICVAYDPAHDVFRPISMYQTPAYWYLGNVFVGLLVVASILMVRKQLDGLGAKLEVDKSRSVERCLPLMVSSLALTCLLVMLLLTPIQYGGWHLLLAVAAMVGYSIYLFSIALAFGDDQLKWIAVSMLGLCPIPAFIPDAFGIVENCLLTVLLLGFMHFYYGSLEADNEQTKARQCLSRKPARRRVVTRIIGFDDRRTR